MALGKERLVSVVDPEGRAVAVACSNARQAEDVVRYYREPYTLITVIGEDDGVPRALERYAVSSGGKLVRAGARRRKE